MFVGILCFLGFLGVSQDKTVLLENTVHKADQIFQHTLSIPSQGDMPFRSIALFLPNVPYVQNKYRTISQNAGISEWKSIEFDTHTNENRDSDDLLNSLIFISEDVTEMEFQWRMGDQNISTLSYQLEIYYQRYEEVGGYPQNLNRSNNDCLCPAPGYFSREQWDCPWGEDSTIFVPEYSELTHIIIHHQAGSASEPYANTVKAIWNYHVNVNGWSDIGYHWLIAPNGEIFKGRAWLEGDENVQGAHMCSCNANKMGICLLGNLTTQEIPTAQYDALVEFLASKACELDIEPLEKTDGTTRKSGTCQADIVDHIMGHRDGCAPGYTECPGDAFYPKIDSLIDDVQQVYESCLVSSSVNYTTHVDKNPIYPNPGKECFQWRLNTYDPNTMQLVVMDNFSKRYSALDVRYEEGVLYFSLKVPSGVYQIIVEESGQKLQEGRIVVVQ